MSAPREISRRHIVLSILGLGAAACDSGARKTLRCEAADALPPADVVTRVTLAYVDASPDSNKTCARCQQYVAPPSDDACGGCKILRGPIHPKGYCKSWAARPA